MTAAATPESILACADEAADAAAAAGMLAAMAAAAIANGAVALPEVGDAVALLGVGGAAGAFVTATVTGIAVAMAFVAVAASCCAEAAGSVEEPAAAVSPDDDFAADFAVSDFGLPDFARDGGVASALVLELPLEGCGGGDVLIAGIVVGWRVGGRGVLRSAVVRGRRSVVGAAIARTVAAVPWRRNCWHRWRCCCRPARRKYRFRGWIGPRSPRRRALKRHVCRCF